MRRKQSCISIFALFLTFLLFIINTVPVHAQSTSTFSAKVEPIPLYEGETVVITVIGCPSGQTVSFKIRIDDEPLDDNQFPESSVEKEAERTVDGNGNAIYSIDEGLSVAPRWVEVVCKIENPPAPYKMTFHVQQVGVEAVYIPYPPLTEPGTIPPYSTFKAKLVSLNTEGTCYFFKIKDLGTGNFMFPKNGQRIEQACNNDIDDAAQGVFDVDRGFYNHKGELYQSFRAETPEQTFDIDGLPQGLYRFELWYARGGPNDLNMLADGKLDWAGGWKEFLVGSAYTPPGKVPCLVGEGRDPEGTPFPIDITEDTDLETIKSKRDQIVKCTAVPTAFGVLNVDPKQIVSTLLGIVLGFVGGIALLLIIYAGYKLVTSRGNPEQIESARETLTSAIIGLLFIIFSVVILEVIGVDILKIPGFGCAEGEQEIGGKCIPSQSGGSLPNAPTNAPAPTKLPPPNTPNCGDLDHFPCADWKTAKGGIGSDGCKFRYDIDPDTGKCGPIKNAVPTYPPCGELGQPPCSSLNDKPDLAGDLCKPEYDALFGRCELPQCGTDNHSPCTTNPPGGKDGCRFDHTLGNDGLCHNNGG